MAKEDFKQRVLEQQIFDEIKDCSLRNSTYFRSKYKGSDIDFSRLYRRIVNYQIQEYGCTLDYYTPKKTKQELIREYQRARYRKYERKSRRYENNNI